MSLHLDTIPALDGQTVGRSWQKYRAVHA